MVATLSAGPAGNQELLPHLAHGWQEPMNLGHLQLLFPGASTGSWIGRGTVRARTSAHLALWCQQAVVSVVMLQCGLLYVLSNELSHFQQSLQIYAICLGGF